MVLYFILGIIIGFVFSFLIIKRTISRQGSGELKVCKNCPHYIKAYNDRFNSDVTENEKN